MSDKTDRLHILLAVGNCAEKSKTRMAILRAKELLEAEDCATDLFDCAVEGLPLFNIETSTRPSFRVIWRRVQNADVLVLGSPDYHGSMSGALKNFLDHFWKEYAGKLFASVVGSHEKGLTVHDQIRTVARQCYAWTLPYGISFHEGEDFGEDQAIGRALDDRLRMMAADIARYGRVLKEQRAAGLSAGENGFMARYR